MLELTLRLVFSLAVVVGLMLLIAKVTSRRLRAPGGALVQVVQRQALSRAASVAVVTIGERVLVLGATEHQVSLLAELDADELEVEVEELDAAATELRVVPRAGSLLSADTWRQALAAAKKGPVAS